MAYLEYFNVVRYYKHFIAWMPGIYEKLLPLKNQTFIGRCPPDIWFFLGGTVFINFCIYLLYWLHKGNHMNQILNIGQCLNIASCIYSTFQFIETSLLLRVGHGVMISTSEMHRHIMSQDKQINVNCFEIQAIFGLGSKMWNGSASLDLCHFFLPLSKYDFISRKYKNVFYISTLASCNKLF